jgi:putative transposase
MCTLKAPLINENRLIVPIEINGKPFKALVDPGATASFIHSDAAAKLELKLEQTPGPPARMADGTPSPKQITVDKITLLCNGHEIETKVLSMHLDEYNFLIGMDLFNRLGYFIGGANNPAIGPLARYEEILIETDMPPAIVAIERPKHELTKDFQKKQEDFIKQLQPYLSANAAIDPQSFCTHPLMEVDLAIPPGVTVYQRPHKPFPQAEKANVQKQIDTWLADGVIVPTPGRVSHLNQLTLAARRDLEGHILKTRLCLDPRNLNSHLLNCDNFQLPRIGDILEKASGHKYFSTIDLRQAYHRLPLTKKSQPLTTFDHNGKQYMFARAPFGLKPMTSIFQRGMMKIFEDLDWVAIYVDDIVIFSDSAEEHSRHVQEVLQRLTKQNLIVNPEKCHFFCTEVVLLGFIVNKNGRRINPEKIANVQTWAAPTNAKMVQRYLGLFNYFREYIPLYSTLAAPLDRLRYKKGNFVLNHIQSKCFENLKLLVQRAPALTFPDFTARFYVATDASNLGIGAVLYQLPNGPSDETKVHYISFMARSLKKHELNYPAYKKELLAIVYALKQFECYLIGRSFTLFTDHRPLTYMHTQSELPTTIANWREALMKFDFQCVYRPGMLNIIPDALSRAFPEELWKTTDAPNPRLDIVTHQSKRIKTTIAAVSTRSSFRPNTTDSNEANTENPYINSKQLARHIEGLDIDTNAPYIHVMQTEDREYVLPSIHDQELLLREIHDFGHLNANAMVDAIHRRGYSWRKLKVTCTDWVLKCPQCQRFNIAQKGYHPLKAIHASLPGEHIAIDLAHLPLSENGNCSILVVVDVCSRFVFLEAIPDKTATTVASRLFKLFCLIGFPKIVQGDNGSEFVNQVINHLMTTLKIEHRLTTPYHPRANGVAERTVRTLKLQLEKSVLSEKPLWDDHLPMVQLQMNNRVASLHSSTPFSLFYGRLFPGLHDFQTTESRPLSAEQMDKRLEYLTALVYPAISEKTKASQQKMIKAFNKTHRLTEFTPGSFVMVKDEEAETALDPKYDGPFKIVRRTSKGTYILRDNMGRLLARNYAPEQLKAVLQSSDIPTEETETDHHEVEKILSHRLDTEGGKILYTVKWKGYDESENSEIPYENFDSKKTVDLYYDRIQKNNPHLLATQTRRLETRQLKLNKVMQKQTPSFSIQTRKRSAPQN